MKMRFTICFLLILWAFPVYGQAQEPVVYGVFFYSPACSHCHDVIVNDWDTIQDEFGDQLRVMFVNVQQPDGSQLMTRTTRELSISSNGVPMLIIGDEVLVGSLEIPSRTAQVVRAGLANGGIAPPAVTGMETLFTDALGTDYVQVAAIEATTNDIANTLAVGVLVALIASLLLIVLAWVNPALRAMIAGRFGKLAMAAGLLAGLGLTFTLVFGSTSFAVTLLAAVLSVLIALVLVGLFNQRIPAAAGMSLIAVTGLLVAGYMATVEITTVEAVCGAIGACNVVQQSQYAAIFGVPIGIIGVVGYAVLLFLFALGNRTRQALWLAFILTIFGVIFSIYLTYLEPFVIEATCVWCLTSAVVMFLLLWMLGSELLNVSEPSYSSGSPSI